MTKDERSVYNKVYRETHKLYMKEYRHKNKEAIRAQRAARRKLYPEIAREQINRYRYQVRQEVITRLGGCCACCGESRFEFLAIDHIFGGGNQHRQIVGSGPHIARWLKKHAYPEGFQVLCHNCNHAKAERGICPHARDVAQFFKIAVGIDK